jgi:diadenosine tetraphosphatase ApaH/serine/threonine PP2A family protein phosphatase
MRRAVLSDIHGNLGALRSVLRDVERAGADEIITLGDNVGYGPDPDEVVQELAARGATSCLGNHEQALLFTDEAMSLNPHALHALERTRELLSPQSLEEISRMPRVVIRGGARFVHGAPPDLVTTYLFQFSREGRLEELFGRFPEELCFCGHTHELRIFTFDGGEVRRYRPEPGVFHLAPGVRHIINCGSVGQPRDGDRRAKWVLWDHQARTVDFRFVEYDIDPVARRILARGLPRMYADRLYG